MIDQEKYNHYVRKYLGWMPIDQQQLVEITNEGLVYEGNLIVAIRNLKDQLTIKVEDVKVEESKETTEEPKVEPEVVVEAPKAPRRKRRNSN